MMTNTISFHSVDHISVRLPANCRALRAILRMAGRALFDIRVEGRRNVPRGNCVIVANHLSWLDVLLLMIYLPPEPRVYVLGAAQAVDRPWKARLMEWVDCMIPVVRGAEWVGKDALTKPLKVLRAGASLLLFPEGEVGTREGQLLPLKTGIGHLLKRADVPVLPIALSGTRELWWHKPIRIIVGQPFHASVPRGDLHSAVPHIVAQVAEQLRRLLPRYEEQAHVWKPLRHLLTDLPDHGV
ncbi:MAG: 1-acyl-sn-glycerol-3-phosphate acyltransferase [Chloroflexi bacterium]|nr:1-acyl-sn-glycerol-3-phosphate acyltransferase [Chloroflexota bacterium]